jgi:hypothetical protein
VKGQVMRAPSIGREAPDCEATGRSTS